MTVVPVRRVDEPPVRRISGLYAALDFSFSVECDEPVLHDELSSAFASLSSYDAGAVVTGYSVASEPDGTFTLTRDGLMLRGSCAGHDLLEWLMWDVNRSAAEASSRYLLLHAAAVEHGGAGVLLPGASGAGKSTMAAALVMDGFGYLTDELVGLAGREMVPFPKALSLDRSSAGVLGLPIPPHEGHGTFHVPADELRPASLGRPCEPVLVVFPRIDPSRPTTMDEMDSADAMLALIANCVNLPAHGGRAFHLLAEIVAASRCYRLSFSEIGDACRMVRGRMS